MQKYNSARITVAKNGFVIDFNSTRYEEVCDGSPNSFVATTFEDATALLNEKLNINME